MVYVPRDEGKCERSRCQSGKSSRLAICARAASMTEWVPQRQVGDRATSDTRVDGRLRY